MCLEFVYLEVFNAVISFLSGFLSAQQTSRLLILAAEESKGLCHSPGYLQTL